MQRQQREQRLIMQAQKEAAAAKTQQTKAESQAVRLEAEAQIVNDWRVKSTETFRHKYSWQHDEVMKLRQKLALAGQPADTTTLRPRSQSAYLARSASVSPRSPSRAAGHQVGPHPSAPLASPHFA